MKREFDNTLRHQVDDGRFHSRNCHIAVLLLCRILIFYTCVAGLVIQAIAPIFLFAFDIRRHLEI